MAESEQSTPAPDELGDPTVIVSHLDVHYTVYGSGRRGTPSGQGTPISFSERLRRNRPTPKVREIHAVKDVSFIARHGESIGIIGRNGSGKSTLLRAVAGLIPPSAGRLWVAGEPSLLGVNAVLMSKLSGERNIYIGAQALGLSKAEIAERFDDIVEFAGIGDAVYLPMNTYSSGMGARLRFAISTAAAPDVLMIDEALATGDAHFREKSARRIADIREQAGTVFLVSHSNSSIRQICDRVLWMDQGRLVMDGPADEILTAYEATLPKKGGGKKKATPQPKDQYVPGTTRFLGENRFQVAAQITQNTWQPGVGGCFIVSVHRLATARLIAPVAARLGWPLLWVRTNGVPTETLEELGRLQPERVVVVGGEELVDPETCAALDAIAPGRVERVGDDDAMTASAAVLEAFPPANLDAVHVTHTHSSGLGPVTSLRAALEGRAVVAVDATTASAELLTALGALGPERLLFHDLEDDWAPEVLEQLRSATGASTTFTPRGGPTAVAADLWDDAPTGGRAMVVGRSPVELLTAAVAAVHSDMPLLVLGGDRVPARVREVFGRLQPSHIILAGTYDSLPPSVRQALGELVHSDEATTPKDESGIDTDEDAADASSERPSPAPDSRTDSTTR